MHANWYHPARRQEPQPRLSRRPAGSASERLAHWLVSSLLTGADAYLDLHGGDLIEALTPFALHHADNARARALAEAFALPTPWA